MKRYITLDMDNLADLSLMEHCILQNIQYLEDDNGWCSVNRKALAEYHQISPRMYGKYTSKFIKNGYLTTRSNNQLKTTKKYTNLVGTGGLV